MISCKFSPYNTVLLSNIFYDHFQPLNNSMISQIFQYVFVYDDDLSLAGVALATVALAVVVVIVVC